MSGRLDGKTAVVTGGSSGIGKAIAELFVAEGANVVVGDIQDEKGQELESAHGGKIVYRHADMLEEGDIAALVDAAVESFGALDVMVNNAGVASEGLSLLDLDTDRFDRQISLLTRAVVLGHKYAGRRFREQGTGGSIVSTASVAGLEGGWADVAYTSAKHAVTGVIRCATAELGPLGIRSNAIYPGVTLAPSMSGMFVSAEENTEEWIAFLGERFADAQPIKRAGRPEDQAQAALFLADDKSSGWISGASLPVDGGTSAVYMGAFGEIGPKAAADWLSREQG
jgi:NAD(P)-dependent dehydrogenase (short-subunit alcohol dehydrogenase family)